MIQTYLTISCHPTSTLRVKTSWERNLRNLCSDKKNWSKGRIRSFSSWMERYPRTRKKAARYMMMTPTKKRKKSRRVLIMMISIKKAHRCLKSALTSVSFMLSSETHIRSQGRMSWLSQTKSLLISLQPHRKLPKPALLRLRALQARWSKLITRWLIRKLPWSPRAKEIRTFSSKSTMMRSTLVWIIKWWRR